jgi:hypothetical protein
MRAHILATLLGSTIALAAATAHASAPTSPAGAPTGGQAKVPDGDQAGVVVTGEATLQPALIAQLETWLSHHGHALVASPLDPESTSTLIDCFVIADETCARGVVDNHSKAQTIVYARVDATPNEDGEGGRDVTLVAYWVQKGAKPIVERRLCEHCTDQALRSSTDDLMAALIAVRSSHDPSKAASLRIGDAGAGDDAVLVPPPAADPEHDSATSRPAWLVPAIVVGSGAALAITGGILIAIDQNPDPHGPQQPTYRDTAAGGVALVSVGVAAAAVGAYLWWRTGSHGAPVAAATHDSAVVGWAGRF